MIFLFQIYLSSPVLFSTVHRSQSPPPPRGNFPFGNGWVLIKFPRRPRSRARFRAVHSKRWTRSEREGRGGGGIVRRVRTIVGSSRDSNEFTKRGPATVPLTISRSTVGPRSKRHTAAIGPANLNRGHNWPIRGVISPLTDRCSCYEDLNEMSDVVRWPGYFILSLLTRPPPLLLSSYIHPRSPSRSRATPCVVSQIFSLFITQEWRERIALDRAPSLGVLLVDGINRCPVRGWDVFTTRRQL